MKNTIKSKKGISLIVLVLTIIIMIILATAIILSLSNSGIIGRSSEAKLKSDISTMQEELGVLKANSTLEGSNEEISINDLSSAKSYKEKFAIQDDELKFVRAKLTEEEVTWAEEVGLKPYATVLVNGENGVTITDGVLDITDKSQFNLVDIKVPEGVTCVGQMAFYGCSTLKSVEIPTGVTVIDGASFNHCTNLTSVVVANGVTTIGSSAFYECKSLTNIILPDSLLSIGAGAFCGCSSLTMLRMPDTVTSISASSFSNCSSLEHVELSKSLTEIIGFSGCYSLTSITIPAGVTKVYQDTFMGCKALKNIIIDGEARFTEDDVKYWFYYTGEYDISDITITGSGYISE